MKNLNSIIPNHHSFSGNVSNEIREVVIEIEQIDQKQKVKIKYLTHENQNVASSHLAHNLTRIIIIDI